MAIKKRLAKKKPLIDDQTVIQHISDKLEKLDSRLDSIDTTLVKQSVTLTEHIRRTNILEENLKPVQNHVNNIQGALWFLGGCSVLAGLIIAALKLFL